MFFENQSSQQKEEYIKTLQAVGSLSNLFSDNEIPYLYYRATENIFCRALDANNLSRSDITYDEHLDGVGIDSVIITKLGNFQIYFAETGTYEEFEENYK